MKKVLAWLVMMVLVLNVFVGCSQGEKKEGNEKETAKQTEEPSGGKTAKDITIGYSFQGLSDEYIVFLKEAVDAKAKELGVNILIADGQMSAEKQISQVENFIAQKVDAIVLNPISMDGCAPAVAAASEAGIPIITLISIVSNQDLATSYVGSNSIESGEIEMQLAADGLGGKGNIVVMFGQMGHDAQIGRYEGLNNVLKNYPDIKIVAEQTGNWSREEGMTIMENWLSSGKEIDAVVAQNDAMALGALMAIEAKGLLGEIQVYGIDAIPEALNALEEDKMNGTVFQDAKGQGAKSVEVALSVAMGETVDKNVYIPYLPVLKKDVPNYK
ncbi:sugar ABC transporter substrate-binding protein [Vallitalea pronyensis]|uniref:Sugar ABC transporter substrate-binding protein n=1 Tax=Vallitalea pronyensis TaxID=1348613 RepID=A0A8J8MIF9_9FIRM|nr:sugar ABC transporter substrate-binding protein [Vallitalea pronyensis]QUI22189.1 sugar ABC transporter substrate-binding protein [Vallitalea pronyensis]